MKNTVKKVLALVIALALLALAGCSQTVVVEPSTPAFYKIGVIQYATHPSLDNCYTGFIEGLAEYGLVDGENVVIEFQNGNGDMSNTDLQAKNMVSSGCKLVVGIATPAAMSAYAACKDADIPVIFNAVSDPVAAGIVASLESPETNCTGSADVLNFDAQLEMITAFLPDCDTIGVLYTTSEPNSISQLAALEAAAAPLGITIESLGVTNSSEVATAAAAIVAKGVDCVTNLTDNNVVDNLSTLLHATDEAGIPVFGSEEEQVKNGCIGSMSIDYIEIGRASGTRAAQILLGEKTANELPVSTESSCSPVVNSAVAAKLSLGIPEAYADVTDVA